MKAKLIALLASLAIAASIGTVTAMAADTETEPKAEAQTPSYSYQAGQQRSSTRHGQFAEAASLTDDTARQSFFAEKGIGGDGPYSASQQLNAEALVEAGIIDQATADRIAAYAAEKHTDLHAKYESKSGMTPQERASFFESFKSDDYDRDPIGALLSAGIITQEQADAINAYLAG